MVNGSTYAQSSTAVRQAHHPEEDREEAHSKSCSPEALSLPKRRTTILIIPRDGTRTRRLVIPRSGLQALRWSAAVLASAAALFVADYAWLKLEKDEFRRLKARYLAQQERLVSLQQKTTDVEHLFSDWKELRDKVHASLPRHRRAAANGGSALEDLDGYLASIQAELRQLIAAVPSAWPTRGRVSSGVGTRPSPWNGELEFHAGLDIPKPSGSPVYAPGSAVVKFAGESDGSGRAIVLNHGQGITTQYAHLSEIRVKSGEHVLKGQHIGDVGSTGRSTGSHLHYEVRVNGVPIDPRGHLLKQEASSS